VIAYRLDDVEREEERLVCSRCPFGGRCETVPGRVAFEDEEGKPELVLESCPRRHVLNSELPLCDPFAWRNRLEQGVLPEPGGWLDQPNLYVETMELLSRLIAQSRLRWKAKAEEKSRDAAAFELHRR